MLTITTSSFPVGQWNTAYSLSLTATGGVPPYTWSLLPGTSLVPGVSLNPDGTVTGTPLVSAVVDFAVIVTDSAAATDQKSFQMVAEVMPEPVAGQAYSYQFTQAYAAAVMSYYQPLTTQHPPFSFFNHLASGGSWGLGAILSGWNSWYSMTQGPGPIPTQIGGLVTGTAPNPLSDFVTSLGIMLVDQLNQGFVFDGEGSFFAVFARVTSGLSGARYRPFWTA